MANLSVAVPGSILPGCVAPPVGLRAARDPADTTMEGTMIDWRTGLLRLYVVLWGGWALAAGARLASRFGTGEFAMHWPMFLLLAVVLPGALFLGLRWTLDGFFRARAEG